MEEKEKPMEWGKFGVENFLIFLDTGASVNLMGEDLYLKYFRDCQLWDTKEVICDIHAKRIDVVGMAEITFSMGNQTMSD